ncbi:MAG TPA: CsgG/HfaB family protein [Victivallales bacterium]|nr:CsgG/HfaB family protein [Victivallales bacterium]HPO89942.1 CsgG/HfaB family protein [Victivallales bacterium]HRU01255.1 CsgG/HfaB family protein [Victivallales bacterium]
MKKIFAIVLLFGFALSYVKTAERPTLAVMPFIIDQRLEIRFGDTIIQPTVIETTFSDQLMQNLVKSRKFDVLERANIVKIMNENNLTESDYAKPGEAERIGKLLVADYLVVGYIDRLEYQAEQKNIQITGEQRTYIIGTLKVHFRVVETKSGKIVCAHSITEKLNSKNIPFSDRKEMTIGDFQDKFFESAAVKASNYVLEGIYPIKVASVSGLELMLNRGDGSGLNKGDILYVYEVGEIVKDPDTGEFLGAAEAKIAEIEITDVLQKFSKARILTSTGNIVPGSICRRAEKVVKQEQPDYPRVTPGW